MHAVMVPTDGDHGGQKTVQCVPDVDVTSTVTPQNQPPGEPEPNPW
jgi:hypothetical protein